MLFLQNLKQKKMGFRTGRADQQGGLGFNESLIIEPLPRFQEQTMPLPEKVHPGRVVDGGLPAQPVSFCQRPWYGLIRIGSLHSACGFSFITGNEGNWSMFFS